MVLSDDYTPKYAVAEGRLIPLSLAAVRGGIGGFSHPPQGIPDGTCREFVKKWRICPRGLPAGAGIRGLGRAGQLGAAGAEAPKASDLRPLTGLALR